ncbi:MAG: Rrf2 family transcriptional regulator [Actinobacteria bacterium]|nr:Rrf2 family transcriptional regulator [Actinomycetota bacterium]
MNGTLRLSEAFNLGLHAACYLASRDGGRASIREIASYLGVSEAHLAKVMQRLVRCGVLKSFRGPGGGFVLARESSKISLMDIYEGLEGRFSPIACLLGRDSCLGRSCVLGGLTDAVDHLFERYLRETDLETAGEKLRAQGERACSRDKGPSRRSGSTGRGKGVKGRKNAEIEAQERKRGKDDGRGTGYGYAGT